MYFILMSPSDSERLPGILGVDRTARRWILTSVEA
jgi:hypothetical protein